ncbi:MAG TPA: hypothetical protein VGV09_14220 [Steroidobacteraceae bacterium]|nr:hypothetical protein [Steroidobacteraceae bacterium]
MFSPITGRRHDPKEFAQAIRGKLLPLNTNAVKLMANHRPTHNDRIPGILSAPSVVDLYVDPRRAPPIDLGSNAGTAHTDIQHPPGLHNTARRADPDAECDGQSDPPSMFHGRYDRCC